MTHENLILILGGTGKTGHRVVERLNAQNLRVRIGSRSAERPFDWDDPLTWGAALQDVHSVYITFQPDLAIPGAEGVIRTFTALAVARGVQRLVLLSGRGEEEAQRCEQIVQTAGVEWTIVRASWFNQNFSESFFLEPLLNGELALPIGDIQEPFIDAEDIADVVVAALTESRHVGQSYEVTGPRLLTFEQVIAEIASATGRDIRFVQVSSEDYMVAQKEAGVPEEYVWLTNYLFTIVLDGRNAFVTDGVQRALGRSPRNFSDYVRQTAASSAWDVIAQEQI